MGRQLSLSAGEWQIMECLWEKSPRTLMEMVRELSPSTGWHKSTVVTMVGRLEAKGAVGYIEGGRARLYSPSISRWSRLSVSWRAAWSREMESLLHRVYRGSVGLMINTLADGRGLSAQDIAELSAVLEKARGRDE